MQYCEKNNFAKLVYTQKLCLDNFIYIIIFLFLISTENTESYFSKNIIFQRYNTNYSIFFMNV